MSADTITGPSPECRQAYAAIVAMLGQAEAALAGLVETCEYASALLNAEIKAAQVDVDAENVVAMDAVCETFMGACGGDEAYEVRRRLEWLLRHVQ